MKTIDEIINIKPALQTESGNPVNAIKPKQNKQLTVSIRFLPALSNFKIKLKAATSMARCNPLKDKI
jgi:hypothetical protein